MAKTASKRADVPRVDRYRRTALHYAALENDVANAQELIVAHAAINMQDVHGRTPLHFAAQSNAVVIAKRLLAAGADVSVTDAHGNTPLFTAVFNSKGDGAMIALLRQHGANPYHQNKHGQSPVGLARLIANYAVAQFFDDLPQ
jgi:ankyrin repeat protein